MKKIILSLASSLLFATSAYATLDKAVSLSNLSIIDLKEIQQNRLEIDVEYPGKYISGSCSIVIRSDRGDAEDAFKKLADRFIFINSFTSAPVIPDSSNHAALVFPLVKDNFVDGITIESKDGKSIAENVSSSSVGYVGVFAGVCA